ncbi:MAG: rhodanese-related sulfurtransferase [Saprospiraceae bacterium]
MRGKTLHNKVNRDELRALIQKEEIRRTTLSFYVYAYIPDPDAFRDSFYKALQDLDVFGRIYVAHEGVNAQLSVPTRRLDELRAYLDTIPFLNHIRLNIAVEDNGKSFFTLAIKVREKIVADGLTDPGFDVRNSGVHLNAESFNQLTEDPETIVVDMRNHYESEVGYFEKAILPPMETFREGLPMVAEMLGIEKEKNIIMYCTGGIRCEKASAYLKFSGFTNVYQLDGGIIEYARQVEQSGLRNKFIGKNFVFDERLGERISDDVVATCHLCGAPCDTHTNCANSACHLLFIQCPECANDYEGCCSVKCQEFNTLPESERKALRSKMEFNGTKFSKSKPGML